jgi:hypothetical protein
MHGFNYLADTLRGAFATVFEKFNQIALFEVPAHPVFLLAVFEDAVALEDPVSELTDVEVAVFKYLFSHSVELGIHIVPPLNNF